MDDQQLALGTTETAKRLNMKRETVSRMCRERKFPNAYQYAPGHPWSIPITDIEAFEQRRKEGKRR